MTFRKNAYLIILILLILQSVKFNTAALHQDVNKGSIESQPIYSIEPIIQPVNHPENIHSVLGNPISKPNLQLDQNITYVAPDVITTGDPQTYGGEPLTDDIFGVNWSSAIDNYDLPLNGNNSLKLDAIVEVHTSQVLSSDDLRVPEIGLIPEWTTEVYLQEGMFVTADLNWDNSEANFDLLLVHSQDPKYYPFDYFGCSSCTEFQPEHFEGYILHEGLYTLIVDFYEGDFVDHEFTLNFTGIKNIVDYTEQSNSTSISLNEIQVSNGRYKYTSNYESGGDEDLSYNGTFLFDNRGPEIEMHVFEFDERIRNETWWIYFEQVDEDPNSLFFITDATEFNYSVFLDGEQVADVQDNVKVANILANDSFWLSETDEISFSVEATDIMGNSVSKSGTIIRADSMDPIISFGPPSNPEVKLNEEFFFAWIVEDIYPQGWYDIKIGTEIVQSGIWTSGTAIEFRYTFTDVKQYILIIEVHDPFLGAFYGGMISDVLTFSPGTDNEEPTPVEPSSSNSIISHQFSWIFVGFVWFSMFTKSSAKRGSSSKKK